MGEGLLFLLRDTFRERRRNGEEIVIDHSSLSRFNQRTRRKADFCEWCCLEPDRDRGAGALERGNQAKNVNSRCRSARRMEIEHPKAFRMKRSGRSSASNRLSISGQEPKKPSPGTGNRAGYSALRAFHVQKKRLKL